MIKVAPRATITDEFKQYMKAIYTARLLMYQNEAEKYASSQAYYQGFLRRKGQAIAQARALVKDPERIDMEYTRLRSLPYTKFETVERENYPYLYGLTRDVTIEFNGKWDMGAYAVVIPLAFFTPMRSVYPDSGLVRKWGAIQMIPMRNMLSVERTPHHKAYMPKTAGVAPSTNPLDMETHTCWGGFASIVYSCGEECDITELFRNIYIYLTRHDPHSPLVHVSREMTERFSFAQRIP